MDITLHWEYTEIVKTFYSSWWHQRRRQDPQSNQDLSSGNHEPTRFFKYFTGLKGVALLVALQEQLTKISRIHPLGTRNTCTKFNGNQVERHFTLDKSASQTNIFIQRDVFPKHLFSLASPKLFLFTHVHIKKKFHLLHEDANSAYCCNSTITNPQVRVVSAPGSTCFSCREVVSG